jgi:hypothetical protein
MNNPGLRSSRLNLLNRPGAVKAAQAVPTELVAPPRSSEWPELRHLNLPDQATQSIDFVPTLRLAGRFVIGAWPNEPSRTTETDELALAIANASPTGR